MESSKFHDIVLRGSRSSTEEDAESSHDEATISAMHAPMELSWVVADPDTPSPAAMNRKHIRSHVMKHFRRRERRKLAVEQACRAEHNNQSRRGLNLQPQLQSSIMRVGNSDPFDSLPMPASQHIDILLYHCMYQNIHIVVLRSNTAQNIFCTNFILSLAVTISIRLRLDFHM
jgi:hypothetical protein